MSVLRNTPVPGDTLVCVPAARPQSYLEKLVGVECHFAEHEDGFWFWFNAKTPKTPSNDIARELPGVFYSVTEDGYLALPNSQVASGRVPATQWTPLTSELCFAMPVPKLLPKPDLSQAKIRLSRNREQKETAAGLYSVADLRSWVDQASTLRLEKLEFAITRGETPMAIVLGSPLPPIDGKLLWQSSQILVPLGFGWTPRLSSEALARLFRLTRSQLLVWESESFRILDTGQLQPVTRASVRNCSTTNN